MQNIVTFTPRTGVSDVRRGDRGPATILILPSVRIERGAAVLDGEPKPGPRGLRGGR